MGNSLSDIFDGQSTRAEGVENDEVSAGSKFSSPGQEHEKKELAKSVDVASSVEPVSEVKGNGKKKKKHGRKKASEVIYEYVQRQMLLESEADYEAFREAMDKPLPVVFRVSILDGVVPGYLKYQLSNWRTFLINDTPAQEQLQLPEGDVAEPPRPLDWVSGERIWYFNASRRAVRKLPALQGFKAFLQRQTDAGHIVRQEAVSMLPPLLLGVRAGQRVLDICAAPGSKTTQLLEDLVADTAK
eukprot:gene1647-2293_t